MNCPQRCSGPRKAVQPPGREQDKLPAGVRLATSCRRDSQAVKEKSSAGVHFAESRRRDSCGERGRDLGASALFSCIFEDTYLACPP